MKAIDIHTHGIGGYDTRSANEEDILAIAEIHGRYGVDAIILTLYPSPIDTMRTQMEAIGRAVTRQQSSVSSEKRQAAIVGVHLEGPFINPLRCGSLDASSCLESNEYAFRSLIEGFEDLVSIVTIAPELPGALDLIRLMTNRGIIASMGHSDATYAEAEEGFRAGASGITHLFNAMRGFHHREPGITGFGLLNQDVFIEIIADPFHLHDRVTDLVFSVKNPERIIIVSDSVKEAMLIEDDSGIRDEKGRLKGGSMTITEAAERLVRQGYDRTTIKRCITDNPRAYLSRRP